jgi:hypothetical protein
VPELQVVGADLTLASPYPNQGIEMTEDGNAGMNPTNTSMKWTKMATRRTE